jgi:hypothetical protein
VLVAVPDAGLPVPRVVHAPTPSDEPLSLPVRVVTTYPLSPDRRRIPAGAFTSYLNTRVGEEVTRPIASLEPEPSILALVPRPSLALGAVDAEVCSAVVEALRQREWLPRAADKALAAPGRAIAVDDAVVEPLADVVDGVLPPGGPTVALPRSPGWECATSRWRRSSTRSPAWSARRRGGDRCTKAWLAYG